MLSTAATAWLGFICRRHFQALVFLLVVVAAQTQPALARKAVGPPTKEEIATTWVGLTSDEAYIFRIVLVADGKSYLGYVFSSEEPKILPIASWSYEKGRIEIEVAVHAREGDWDSRLIGIVDLIRMELEMRGRDWSQKINLRREDELESRWLNLKDSMKKAVSGPSTRSAGVDQNP